MERLGQGLGVPALSPIVPLVVGAEGPTLALSSQLLAAGMHVPAIRPPTVPAGTCRWDTARVCGVSVWGTGGGGLALSSAVVCRGAQWGLLTGKMQECTALLPRHYGAAGTTGMDQNSSASKTAVCGICMHVRPAAP